MKDLDVSHVFDRVDADNILSAVIEVWFDEYNLLSL
jgi:hypothetical protein